MSDTATAVLRGKLIVLNAHKRKEVLDENLKRLVG
jgi:hypothetical protein